MSTPKNTDPQRNQRTRDAPGYRPEYCGIARALCDLGANETGLAEAFYVIIAAIGQWQSTHPEFLEACERAQNAS